MESDQALIQTVIRFNDALNAGDVDGMMRMMTEDCIYENTYPAPDGEIFSGQAAVRVFWEAFFQGSNQPHIEIEEIFAMGERCVMRWVYRWREADGSPHHMRGVDIYRVIGGQIAEKLSYVKG